MTSDRSICRMDFSANQAVVRSGRTTPPVGRGYQHYLFIIFCALLSAVGALVLSVAIWILIDPDLVVRGTRSDGGFFVYLFGVTILLASAGAWSLITVFIGCCAAVKSKPSIFIAFILALLVNILMLLAIGSWTLLQTITLHHTIRESLKESIKSYFVDKNIQYSMESIQSRFGCCGADQGFGDYAIYSIAADLNEHSVCEMQNFGKPCEVPVFEHYAEKLTVISAVSISSVIVELIGVVVTAWRYCLIAKWRSF